MHNVKVFKVAILFRLQILLHGMGFQETGDDADVTVGKRKFPLPSPQFPVADVQSSGENMILKSDACGIMRNTGAFSLMHFTLLLYSGILFLIFFSLSVPNLHSFLNCTQ